MDNGVSCGSGIMAAFSRFPVYIISMAMDDDCLVKPIL